MSFVLASESARRVDLLCTAGYDFEPRKSGFPEVTLDDPVQTVRANAEGKALAVERDPETVVLAADTIVYLTDLPAGERVLGQAKSGEEVEWFVNLMQGRAHEVYSGVAITKGDDLAVRHAATTVKMRKLDAAEIQSYVRHGEGVGKAGGYAIQGRAGSFVEWIGGDYTNVVGLPLALTGRMLAHFGIPYP
ncbi:MAG TPA: Maf family protein [Rubrobacter sp.]|jgi:septum formation protein